MTDEQVVKNETVAPSQSPKMVLLAQNWKEQIRKQQIRFIVTNSLSWLVFTALLILSAMWILYTTGLINFNISDVFVLFSPWIILPVFAISFIISIKNSLDWYRFQKEKNVHFIDENHYEFDRVPNFIIEIYKRAHGVMIFFRWLLIVSIIICGIFLGYMGWIEQAEEFVFQFLGSEITIKNDGNYTLEIIITSCYLSAIVIANIWIWIVKNKEISNLLANYDIRKTFSETDLNSYKKKVNWFCACIFVLPIFIVIAVFWIINRLRPKRK